MSEDNNNFELDIPKYDGLEKKKNIYQKMEDSYYSVLDKINKVFPIYKIIDPIDKVMPSFILVNILFLLVIIAIIILLVVLLNTSAMKVDLDFYYDNTRVNEKLLINISYTDFDKNFDVENGLLTVKLEKDLDVKLKVLSEGYEFTKTYTILEDYIKVNIPKKEVIDTTPKKISIFAYESPNKNSIYSSTLNLSLRCLSSGKTETIVLNGLKDYERAYDCGNIRFTGNLQDFRAIDYTCSTTETVCAVPLVKNTDRTPDENELIPKNNLIIEVIDDTNKVLKDVEVSLTPKTSAISIDKNTDAFGKATYLNLDVGQYSLYLEYLYDGVRISKSDSNVFVVESNSNILKKYVLDLTDDLNAKYDLIMNIDTFDENEIDYELYIYDVNGNIALQEKNGETPDYIKTKLLKGKYYITAISDDNYNPMYFEEIDLNYHTELDVIFEEYDESDFFNFIVMIFDKDGEEVQNAKVSILDIDNNNLIYTAKNTDSYGRAIFKLPNNKDYYVFVEKTGYSTSGKFLKKNIKNGKGYLELTLNEQMKEISLDFTYNNRKVDYMVFVDLGDSNYAYTGNSKINMLLPTNKKIEMSIIYEDEFDVYNYLVSPFVVLYTETYNLKYNYSDNAYFASDLKLDNLMQKDVNDYNLMQNKDYYFSLETELDCDKNKLKLDLPYDLTPAFNLDFAPNSLLTTKNNGLILNDFDDVICSDSGVIYHYKLNSSLKLKTPNTSLEGSFKYTEDLDKNISFKVPGNYVCDILLNGVNIKDIGLPYIVLYNSNIVFSDSCGNIEYNRLGNNNKQKLNDNNLPLNLDKYTFYYGSNLFMDVYVLEKYSVESNPYQEIKIKYDSNVDCGDYFCSVEQLVNNPIGFFGKVNLLYDNFDVVDITVDINSDMGEAVEFNGIGQYTSFLNFIKNYEPYDTNHIFYYIPYKTNTNFLSSNQNNFDYNIVANNYGSKSENSVFYPWDNNLENTIYWSDINNDYNVLLNILSNGIAKDSPLFAFFFAKNNFDINLDISSGISIKACDTNYNDCYKDNAVYFIMHNNLIYIDNIFDVNKSTKKISLKSGYAELDGKIKLVAISPGIVENCRNIAINSLQDIIDYYNNESLYFLGDSNSGFYFWNLDYIIKSTIDPNYNNSSSSILVNPIDFKVESGFRVVVLRS